MACEVRLRPQHPNRSEEFHVLTGVIDCLEGIDAISTFGYEVIYHGSSVNIPYPIQADGARSEGKSFHHGKFIMKLREAAAKSPK